MLIIRPTVTLFKRMQLKPPDACSEGSTTILGDWYANDIVLGRRHLILCVSSKTRLSVVMDAAPYAYFPERLEDSVRLVLESIGIERSLVDLELSEMALYKLQKASDRSITGTLTESAKILRHYQAVGHIPAEELEISAILNKVPSGKIQECYPKDEALKAFGTKVEGLSLVKKEDTTSKRHLYIVK